MTKGFERMTIDHTDSPHTHVKTGAQCIRTTQKVKGQRLAHNNLDHNNIHMIRFKIHAIVLYTNPRIAVRNKCDHVTRPYSLTITAHCMYMCTLVGCSVQIFQK